MDIKIVMLESVYNFFYLELFEYLQQVEPWHHNPISKHFNF